MLDKLKHTLKHTAIYSLGNMATKVIGLILLPLYTSKLSLAEYGLLNIFEVTSELMVAALSFQLSTAMMRWWAPEKNPKKQRNIVLSTYVTAVTILSAVLLFTLPFTAYFATFFFENMEFKVYFDYLFLWVALSILNRITTSLLRIKEKSLLFITFTITRFTSTVLFIIYFVAYQGKGIEGVILGQVLGNAIILLVSIPLIVKNITNARLDIPVIREMLRYGFPLILATLALNLHTAADRYILNYLASEESVGLYGLANKISSVTNILILQSLQLGFVPIAFKMFNEDNAKAFFARMITYMVLVIFVVSIPLSYFSKELIYIFAKNPDYYIAYLIVPLFCIAYIFRGLQWFFSLGLQFAKQTKYNAVIVIAAVLMNIALNFILIPLFDVYGAGIATILSTMGMSLMARYYSNKHYKFIIEKRLYPLIITGILFLFAGILIDLNLGYHWWVTGTKLIVFLIFPIILFMFRFFHKTELEKIRKSKSFITNPRYHIQQYLKKKKD